MSKHAILSASSAYRWINCPPSALAELEFPDKSSDYAKEGTLAHAMAAHSLKLWLMMNDDIFNIADQQAGLKKEEEEIERLKTYYTEEMDEYVSGYVTFVQERIRELMKEDPDLCVMIEHSLDFSNYVPEGFGTGDVVIVYDGGIDVIDFKYGKGVEVSAENNPQMMLYALGASDEFKYEYWIEKVNMSIYQPRVGNLSTWGISWEELNDWAQMQVKPLATLAINGRGNRCAGDWCRFCRVAPCCKTLAEKNLMLVNLGEAENLTPKEIAEEVLPALPAVSQWMERVKEYTLAEALNGTIYPGYKLVHGRSVRRIKDDTALLERLTDTYGYKAEDVTRPATLKTITELERSIGKKRFAEIAGDLIAKPPGAPTLVVESDKRDPMTPGDDFTGMV